MEANTHMVNTKPSRPWIIALIVALTLAGASFGAVITIGNRPLTASDVIGEWVLVDSSHELRFTIREDGSMESADWPSSLGCFADTWPTSVDGIDWDERGLFSGRWTLDATGSSLMVYPDAECSAFSIDSSPILGDRTLSVHLDLSKESTPELRFRRK